MLEPGYYNAKIVGYGMRKTKDTGILSPTIKFQVVDGQGRPAFVFWQKNLSTAKSTNVVLEELITCGLQMVEHFANIADGPEGNALDMNKEVQITVEHNTWEGKTNPKVAWINALRAEGAGEDRQGIKREEAQRLLETIDLQDAFDKAFAKVNKNVEAPAPF